MNGIASSLVVVPQPDEAEALLTGFVRHGVSLRDVSIGRMNGWFVPVLELFVAVGGIGKAQFALQTQHLLDVTADIRLVICAGAAGRLDDRLNIGDVVVATATIEHDFKEQFTPKPLPSFETDAETVTQLRHAAVHQFPFGVHFGPIASGDEDIVNRDRAAQLRLATGALCAAWEGSGGARAARFNQIGFLEIRAITDAADDQAASSYHENLGTVVPNIADLLFVWRAGSSLRATEKRIGV